VFDFSCLTLWQGANPQANLFLLLNLQTRGTAVKTNLIFKPCLVLTVLLLSLSAPAQGTLYLSNLAESSIASGAVGSDSWLAEGFITGTNANGYVLNSVQLLMGESSLSPEGFAVSIYNSFYGSQFPYFATPGNSLGSLSGPDPSAGGLFTYTAASGLTFLPRTFYFVVVTADTPVATGSYDWSATQNTLVESPDQWALDDVYFSSTDGANWVTARNYLFQLGTYATAVPEPSSVALLLLGGGTFALFRRVKAKAALD
jgi:hypothetical protein